MIQRRQFINSSVALSTVWLLNQASGPFASSPYASAVDFAKPVPAAEGLTAYVRDGNVQIRLDNLPLLTYRAQSSLKYPYFCPMNGPRSGLSLVAESAEPYPHHRGLWLGCDPVNGGNYWADNGLTSGHIQSAELKLAEPNSTVSNGKRQVVSFSNKCIWSRGGSTPFHDERRFIVAVPDERTTILDCDLKLTAQEDISIKSAKHSLFAIRVAADLSPSYGGTLVNSAGGIGADTTYGKPADWCAYFGKRRLRPDLVEGIAIMNHPKNFGGKCPWFTRDYGHLSPSPFAFLEKPWTLANGESLALRYRVVMFTGSPMEAGLSSLFQEWI